MSRNGEWLACYAQEPTRRLIRIWNVREKKLVQQMDLPVGFHLPSGLAMSTDGRYLAIADSSDLLAIWDRRQPQAPPVIPQPHEVPVPTMGRRGSRPVQQVVFSQDGDYLTTLYDGRAYLWHVATGIQLAVTARAEGDERVTYVSLGKDGKSWLIGRSRALGLVDLNPSVWQYWACIDAGGSISPEDWSRLLPGLPYRCTCARNFRCSTGSSAGRGSRHK
jgi:WD40 repeat protein